MKRAVYRGYAPPLAPVGTGTPVSVKVADTVTLGDGVSEFMFVFPIEAVDFVEEPLVSVFVFVSVDDTTEGFDADVENGIWECGCDWGIDMEEDSGVAGTDIDTDEGEAGEDHYNFRKKAMTRRT